MGFLLAGGRMLTHSNRTKGDTAVYEEIHAFKVIAVGTKNTIFFTAVLDTARNEYLVSKFWVE